MVQKKDKKYFEDKIKKIENKMNAAESELIAVGTEMLCILNQEEKYEATITTDGLTFIEKNLCDYKDPCNYLKGVDEISATTMLGNFEETENEK